MTVYVYYSMLYYETLWFHNITYYTYLHIQIIYTNSHTNIYIIFSFIAFKAFSMHHRPVCLINLSPVSKM